MSVLRVGCADAMPVLRVRTPCCVLRVPTPCDAGGAAVTFAECFEKLFGGKGSQRYVTGQRWRFAPLPAARAASPLRLKLGYFYH